MSPDDQLAASGSDNGKIVIREMKESGRIRHSINAGSGGVLTLLLSKRGEARLRRWQYPSANPASSTCMTSRVANSSSVQSKVMKMLSAVFSGHSTGVSSSRRPTIIPSDVGTPTRANQLENHGRVTLTTYTPFRSPLTAPNLRAHPRIKPSDSGMHALVTPLDQPLQHDNVVNAVTFSPSGEFVASGGDDKKVSIWRVPWWDDSQKQVITAFTYLPTPFLTVFIPAGTQILLRRALSSNVSRSLSDDRLL
jgi:WD40 repeat protein